MSAYDSMDNLWCLSAGKRQYPYVETVVSRLRNSRFLLWKL